MDTRDYRDLIGGGLLLLLGLFAGIYASLNYDLGTVRHMGPGMFPTWLGYLLAVIGGVIMILALFHPGQRVAPDYRQFGAVVLGVLAFALSVELFGMVPAIFALTIGAVLADNKLGVVGTLVLATTLSVIAVLIFRVGLAIPLQVFKWPF